jgi:hypothetical protein
MITAVMDHHFVPQFLLRAWAGKTPDKKLQVFRLDQRKLLTNRLAPQSTAFEPDLYALSVDQVRGMDKQAIEERLLSRVDTNGSAVREILVRNGSKHLSPGQQLDWAIFLMSLRVRQPEIVAELKAGSASELRRQIAQEHGAMDAIEIDGGALGLEEWTEQNFPGLIENFGLTFFHELVVNPNVGQRLTSMRWWVRDLGEADQQLLIADHPCIFTTGIEDEALVVALPIAPTKVFLATKSEHVASAIAKSAPSELALRVNESSLNQARKRVYATDLSLMPLISFAHGKRHRSVE